MRRVAVLAGHKQSQPHCLSQGAFEVNGRSLRTLFGHDPANSGLQFPFLQAFAVVGTARAHGLLANRPLRYSVTMALNYVRFFSLLFVALALAPSAAHLLELPTKLTLSRDDYLTVQQIYRGWELLGIVVFGALLSTLALTVLSRHRRRQFALALTAFLCVVGTQVVFWAFTYPNNQVTQNWTVLPQVCGTVASAVGVFARSGRAVEPARIHHDRPVRIGRATRRQ